MNEFTPLYRSTLSLKTFLVILLVVSFAINASFGSERAYAAITETVTHDQVVGRNPLMIMSAKQLELYNGVHPQEIVLSDYPEDTKITRLTGESAYSLHETRAEIVKYRAGMISNMAVEWMNGYTLEFPSCNGEIPHASVTATYPNVGTYNEGGEPRAVGAKVTYTFTYTEAPLGESIYDYNYLAIQLSDSLFAGIDQRNAKSAEIHISFFYLDTQEPVMLGENTMATIGSLNYQMTGVGKILSEYVSAKDADTIKFQIPDNTDPTTLGNTKTKVLSDTTIGFGWREDNWVDDITHHDFYKQSVSVFQSGDGFRFTVGSGYDADTEEYLGRGMWWSLCSSSIAIPTPPIPTKTVDKETSRIGETLTYRVSQKVHTAGLDIQGKYKSFVFSDNLPVEVDYVADSAKMHRVMADGATSDITDTAGTFTYDGTTHTLVYTFSEVYLEDMDMGGEEYLMEFKSVVNSKAIIGEEINNHATVSINEWGQSAEAKTIVGESDMPEAPTKTADKKSAHMGEVITYTIEQEVQMYGKNIYSGYESFSFDDILPDEVDYVADSAKMHRVMADGATSDITDTAGTFTYDGTTHTLTYAFNEAYLKSMPPAGEKYLMEFKAVINSKAAIEKDILNKATVYINQNGQSAEAKTTVSASPESHPSDEKPPAETSGTEHDRTGNDYGPGMLILFGFAALLGLILIGVGVYVHTHTKEPGDSSRRRSRNNYIFYKR